MRLARFAVLTVAALTGCLPASPTGPAPAAGVPVRAWAIDIDPPRAAALYMRNDTGEDRILTDITLYGCVNLRQPCEASTPNLLIPAGKSVRVMLLEADNRLLRWTYQYQFNTRSVSGTATAGSDSRMPRLPANATVVRFQPKSLNDPEKFVARVPINDAGTAQCNLPRPIAPPTRPSRLMFAIDGLNGRPGRTIMLDLDAKGEVIRYNESRSDGRILSATPSVMGMDTLVARTSIMIQWPEKFALLINQGGGKPAEYFTTSGSKALTAASLGRPADVIAKVLKDCGYQP